MNEHDQQLFDLAVQLIRGGTGYVDLLRELETASIGSPDVRIIITQADKFVKEMQTKSFDAAVEAFRRGETQFDVEKKLRALGFQSWDAMVVAGRAKAKADAELAEVSLDVGLSALGGKSDGQES
jgi:hypothetical protein